MTTTVLDLTDQIKKYNIAAFDVSLYDYVIIQRVGGFGEMYLGSTNDSGAIEGISDGGVSRPIRCGLTTGSDVVTIETTKPISIFNRVFGTGIVESAEVLNIIDETSFQISQFPSITTADAHLSFIYPINWLEIEAENLATGGMTSIITTDNTYRINAPFGKWLRLQGDSGSSETVKLLVFCSKIY